MTPILKVITGYCDKYVDDIRTEELKTSDMPLYAWEMWGLLNIAIPYFKIPEEMQDYLVGENGENLTEPLFANMQINVTAEQTADFTVPLADGYDLCACRLVTTRADGRTILTPISVTYDSETGDAVVSASPENPVMGMLDFDLYKDGSFTNDLSISIMQILGICFQYAWTDRFNTDWLSNIPKIEDKSYYEQNRANKMRADTERLQAIRKDLSNEMRKFSENLRYKKVVPANYKLSLL